MKRKLDENSEPAEPPAIDKSDQSDLSFNQLGLDPRLIQSIAQQKFHTPTPIQQQAIPLILSGKDVIAKAKTGSGKTAAYLLPALQRCLDRKQENSQVLILVPSRELGDQVLKAVQQFASYCRDEIRAVHLNVSDAVGRSLLSTNPHVVVTTPTQAWKNISALSVDKLSYVVLDEADLLLAYGHETELDHIAKALPKGVQTVMMSATMSKEVSENLGGLFCRDPVFLDLQEPDDEGEGVTQYFVKCAEDEKFLLIYVIFKLQLLKGKCIVFVTDVDRCYRLRLFLEQFGIRSAILNHELPVNSRIHVVEEFSRNVYDILIAADEGEVLGSGDQTADGEAPEADNLGDSKAQPKTSTPDDSTKQGQQDNRPRKKKKQSKSDEYGVSRGIDFRNVACVINFDFPTTSKSYTHRIGRTARAGRKGVALSFVVPQDLYRKHVPTSVESAENDERVLAKVVKQQDKIGKEVKPYHFDMKQVEAFRYRMNDALRAVTKIAVREARTRELRQELLTSSRLKRHFEENPAELQHLRHDGELRPARRQAHLKNVPDYLLPAEGKTGLTAEEVGFVPLRKTDHRAKKSKFYKNKGKGFKAGGRKSNPLRTFKAKGKTK